MGRHIITFGKKIFDILIGFFGSIIVSLFIYMFADSIDEFFSTQIFIIIVMQIAAPIIFIVKKRAYIALGIIASWIIPVLILLLIIGACGNWSFG